MPEETVCKILLLGKILMEIGQIVPKFYRSVKMLQFRGKISIILPRGKIYANR